MVVPPNGRSRMENLVEIDDLGVPPFNGNQQMVWLGDFSWVVDALHLADYLCILSHDHPFKGDDQCLS